MTAFLILALASVAPPPICTERPGKANSVCTVVPGHVQFESGLADWSLTNAHGERSEFVSLGATFVRLGLTDSSELQVGISPWSGTTIRNHGARSRIQGFGDLVVRYKQRLTGESAPVQVGLIPFVKAPTAAHNVGNGKAEGGFAVPVSFTLTGAVAMTLGPEVDVLADSDGHGYHPALVNLVNVGVSIAPRLTASGELWSNLNFDPARTVRQASADAALAYALSNDVQLDAGANLGLTRDTPDVEFYTGISARF